MSENENYISDIPIVLEKDDKFQRFGFSTRIAQTIIERKSKDSIVFGLYGEWGEGKSSVLNFIESELSKSETIITIKFNPWRFQNEETLLLNYFETIAEKLGFQIESKKDKAAKFFNKYGWVTKIFNIDNKDVGIFFSDLNIESFKSRVGNQLLEKNVKLVVFIDDIDRLDKKEIHSIFRLVKLTADFSNTIYILSFDKEMVAAAIGERFGQGDKKAGENFLEKIIQVPLSLPKTQFSDIKNYTIQLINNILNENNIEISKDEQYRFLTEFDRSIVRYIKTPRIAVRYSNSLAFVIPMLKGEVNIIDLLIIEAIKILFPLHYEFIKDNPHIFLRASLVPDRIPLDDKKNPEDFKKVINNINEKISDNQLDVILNLLTELFPVLKSVFQNFENESDFFQKMSHEKRICSRHYFERYFTYSILKGEISDVKFDAFITTISTSSNAEIESKVNEMINASNFENLIDKIIYFDSKYDWSQFKKIGLLLSKKSNQISNNKSLLNLGLDSNLIRIVAFISNQIKRFEFESDIYKFMDSLIESSENISFSIELLNRISILIEKKELAFTEDDFKRLKYMLIQNDLSLLDDDRDLFLECNENSLFIVDVLMLFDKERVFQYLKKYISISKDKLIRFLSSFTGIVHSFKYPEPYRSDLKENDVLSMKSYIELEFIEKTILSFYTKEELDKEKLILSERWNKPTSDINLIRQFLYWMHKKQSSIEKL